MNIFAAPGTKYLTRTTSWMLVENALKFLGDDADGRPIVIPAKAGIQDGRMD